MTTGPYAIGSDHLPGLSKLIEELGEAGQVAGKIIGLGHMGNHWDGSNLKWRLEDELADVLAAITFFAETNGLNLERMRYRADEKIMTFEGWHRKQSSDFAKATG